MAFLPPEILAKTFSYLDVDSLDCSRLVCRKWSSLIDDSIYRLVFLRKFATLNVPRLSYDGSWRQELLWRERSLNQWQSTRITTVAYNVGLNPVTDLFADFQTSKAFAFNRQRGIGIYSNFKTGRVYKQKLFAQRLRGDPQSVSCVDASKHFIVYGMYDASVAIVALARSGVPVAEAYNTTSHERTVSCVWVVKGPVQGKSDILSVVSAGLDGIVALWFGIPTAETSKLVECRVSQHGILQMHCSVDRVVVLDTAGFLNVIEIEGTECHPRALSSLHPTPQAELVIVEQYLVVATPQAIYRIELADGTIKRFELLSKVGVVSAFAIDRTSSNGGPTLLSAAFDDRTVATWWLQDDAGESGYIPTTNQWLCAQAADDFAGCQIAMNSVVIVVANPSGSILVMNALTGEKIRQISGRLNSAMPSASRQNRNPQLRVTLQLNEDLMQTEGVLAVGPCILYYGADNPRKQNHKSSQHQPRYRRKQKFEEEIEAGVFFNYEENEDLQQLRNMRQEFALENLSEEDQLDYAMMLSRDVENESDSELAEALRLSMLAYNETVTPGRAPPVLSHATEDEQLDYVLRLSQEEF